MGLEGTEPINRRFALGQKNLVVAWRKITIPSNRDISHPEGTFKTSSSINQSTYLSINLSNLLAWAAQY
jgi:hypothetical protein